MTDTPKITKEWIKGKNACESGYKWALRILDGKSMDSVEFINKLLADDKWDWANWVIVRIITHHQYLAYATFYAENIIDIYEKSYPNDTLPRKAIEANKSVLINGDSETRYITLAEMTFAWSEAWVTLELMESARREIKTRVINYGIKLLEGK